jgi:hypothetical protein
VVYNCSFSQRNCAPFNLDENWSDKDVDLFRRCFFRSADEAVPPLLVVPWSGSVPWCCFLLLECEEDCLLCCCLFLLWVLLFLFFLFFLFLFLLLLFLGFFDGKANMVAALGGGERTRSGCAGQGKGGAVVTMR